MITVQVLSCSRFATVAAVVVLLIGSAKARADGPGRADEVGTGGSIALDAGYFRGTGTHKGFIADGEVWAFRLYTAANVSETMVMRLDLGWSHAFLGGLDTPIGRFDMQDDGRFINPYLGLDWRLSSTRRVNLRLGFGVTIPAAENDDGEARANLLGSMGAWGMRDPWVWPEGVTSLVVPMQGSLRASRYVRLLGDAALALMVRTRGQHAGQLGPAAQARAGAELLPFSALRIGGRAGIVWLPGRDGDPEQLALEPHVALVLPPVDLEARAVLNLDGPFGPTPEAHRQWGLHLTATMAL